MHYYEVLIADGRYHSDAPLTYSSEVPIKPRSVVTVALQNRLVTGFVDREVERPRFDTKPIKKLLSPTPLPEHCLMLGRWLKYYYSTSLGDSLRQFAPSKPSVRSTLDEIPKAVEDMFVQTELDSPLTDGQKQALASIRKADKGTFLLHGDTGSGKTRVYLEMAQEALAKGNSVILLTPEIALTPQLELAVRKKLHKRPLTIHSQLTVSERKKLWLKTLESQEPLIIIGPRSALFLPTANLGLIVVDEAHEPAYKQEQSPRYHTVRVASQLGVLTGSRVILGSATPSITDYYVATQKDAVVGMKNQALTGKKARIEVEMVDIKDRSNFISNPYISERLIKAARSALAEKKQVLIYYNRRGTARLVMCGSCGWQLVCPKCDIPLTYHGDSHCGICHTCGYKTSPPSACPNCSNPDITYKSIGTKALAGMVSKLFPGHTVRRFDSDNPEAERVNELYPELLSGKVDILVGTQVLAKGFDLPRLGLVGIVAAETSVALPDFTAEERTFQLLYQVIGRVGRGHGNGRVVIQTYDPGNSLLDAATRRDWEAFYKQTLSERHHFKFPPYSYLAKLVCRRRTQKGAQNAALNLFRILTASGLSVEVIGPAPSFYEKRGDYYYWQLVLKSKDRGYLLQLAKKVPADWMVDLDPIDLL